MRLPEIELDDRRFQDLVYEARMRISRALPGVDRAQRLRPRHHADRAVRVDDGDDDLPAQPRAGQAARHAARAARDPARRPDRRARTTVRFRLVARRRSSRSRSRRATTEVGTLRTATEESIVFQTTDDFTIPPARPIAYVRRARRRSTEGRRRRGRRGAAAGRRPARRSARRRRSATRSTSASTTPLGAAAAARRRRGLAGARRRRRPRGPAAALGGRRRARRRLGARRACSRTSPAASTTARARSSCSCRRDTRPRRVAGAARCTGCAAGSTSARAPARAATLHAPARDLLDHRRRRSARCSPPTHAAHVEPARCSARATARPGRSSRCAIAPVLALDAGRDARGARTRESARTGERWEPRESFVESRPEPTATSLLDLAAGRSSSGPAIRAGRRRLAPVRRGAAEGRARCASSRYRHGGGRRGNVAAGTLTVLQERDPRRRRR